MTLAQDLARKNLRVLCLEKASSQPKTNPFSADELTTKYKMAGFQAAYGSSLIPIGEAFTLGGGSAINSGIIQRPLDAVCDEICGKYQIQNWEKTLRDFYFTKAEQLLPLIHEPDQELPGQLLENGAKQLQWAHARVAKARVNKTERASLSDLFQSTIENRGGQFKIGSVFSISKDKNWIVKIKNSFGGLEEFQARHLFLACGPVESARIFHLLIRHRFFAKSYFKAHLFCKVMAEFDFDLPRQMDVSSVQIKQFAPDLSFGCSVRNDFLDLSYFAPRAPLQTLKKINLNRITPYYSMSILQSYFKNNITRFGRSWISSHLTTADKENLMRGVQNLLLLLKNSGAAKVYWPKGQSVSLLDDGASFRMQDLSLSTVHLFSGLPLGNQGPLDSYGTFLNFLNLHVCDSSLIPEGIGVNPQLTIMALALRLSDHIFPHGTT